MGRSTVNVEPSPGCERTSIVPPWFSMMRWLIGRPRPVPFSFVVKNGMNRFLQIAGRDADAGVAEAHLEERGRRPAARRAPAALVEIEQLAAAAASPAARSAKVQEHLQQLLGVGAHRRQPVGEAVHDLDLPCSAASLASSCSVLRTTSLTSSGRCSPR